MIQYMRDLAFKAAEGRFTDPKPAPPWNLVSVSIELHRTTSPTNFAVLDLVGVTFLIVRFRLLNLRPNF